MKPVKLPDRRFVRLFLWRAVIIWLGVRLGFVVAAAMIADAGGDDFSPALLPPAGLALVLLVGAVGLFDARRRHEHLLLANLGVSQRPIFALSAATALAAELAVTTVLALAA